MGTFNNYGEYNVEEERTRLATMVKDLNRHCENCIHPDRECSECINKARRNEMKTKKEQIKNKATKNRDFMYLYGGGGRRAGRTYLRNMLLQAQAAETKKSKELTKTQLLNFALQMNFAAVEMQAIAAYLKDNKELKQHPEDRRTLKIEKTESTSTCYSATCDICGTTKILSIELNTMTLVCNKCYTVFNLEY